MILMQIGMIVFLFVTIFCFLLCLRIVKFLPREKVGTNNKEKTVEIVINYLRGAKKSVRVVCGSTTVYSDVNVLEELRNAIQRGVSIELLFDEHGKSVMRDMLDIDGIVWHELRCDPGVNFLVIDDRNLYTEEGHDPSEEIREYQTFENMLEVALQFRGYFDRLQKEALQSVK